MMYSQTDGERNRLDELISVVVASALRQAVYDAGRAITANNPYLNTEASRQHAIEKAGDEILSRLGAYLAENAAQPHGSYAKLTPADVQSWLSTQRA